MLASLLPGILGTAFLFSREYQNNRAQLESNMKATARAMVQSVDSQLFRAKATAQTLSTFGGIDRHDLAGFHRWATNVLAQTKVGMNVVLCDASGQQLINTLRPYGTPLPLHGNLQAIKRIFATGQPEMSAIYIGKLLKKPLMSIDVPVMQHGKVMYVLSMGIVPSQFNSILTTQNFPPDWIAVIFDDQGTIVARTHSPEKFVGRKGATDYIRRIKEASEGVISTTTLEGIPITSVWSRSPRTNWSVGIGIPRQILAQELNVTLYWLIAGMVVLLVIGLGLALLAGRKISRSVHALRAPAQAMGKDNPVDVPFIEIQESAEIATAIHQAAILLEKRAAELYAAHRVAGFGFWQWHPNSGKMVVSDSLEDIFGQAVPPFPQLRDTLLPAASWDHLDEAMATAVQTGIGFDLELQANHASGKTLWLNLKCETIRDANGDVSELHGSVLDITQRKEAELALEAEQQSHLQQLEQQVADRTEALMQANAALEQLARKDILTGLKNRTAANERLRQEFLRLKRIGIPYAVLFLDIDYFKHINDTYGHETGDQVLRQFGEMLNLSLRETDFVARFGGEEFLVILPDTSLEDALIIAEKIRHAAEVRVMPVVKQVTVSIGVAMADGEDKNEEEVVHRADIALYAAKAGGRNRVQSFRRNN
ncbi:sensor domain-containing diguanylate cyclase [Leeia oryzae]|uniref:sensor domain-containing diguanylate cyclase n=1 Tax=Leeia oryzae TaxID=356662 RepID=UPI000399DF4E|nr:diguanylate cyclase [Leeia oryzae]